MTVTFNVRTKLSNGQYMCDTPKELEIGKYNEYYLPALTDGDRHREAFLVVTDDNGEQTVLHLKR